MDLNVKYSNGTPPFSTTVKDVKGWGTPIIELQIEGNGGRTKKASLNDYVINFTYAFRELINKHETDIEEMEIKTVLSNYYKTKDDIVISAGDYSNLMKYQTIVFTLYRDFFNEQLYFTRNADILTEGGIMFEGNKLNSTVIESNEPLEEKFVKSLITAVTHYLPNYEIDINSVTKKLVYTYKGVPLKAIEEVKEDDIFIFFKMVEVLMHRGAHWGIFFLDCEFLSPSVVKALVAFINLYYMTRRMVFLYNVPSDKRTEFKDISRSILKLPNHKFVKSNNGGKKSK